MPNRSIALAMVIAWLVTGCAFLMAPPGTTTEVTLQGPDGDRIIECRSEPPVSGDACQTWGERILAGMAAEGATATRLVLTDGSGVGRCSADFHDEMGGIYASAAVVCP